MIKQIGMLAGVGALVVAAAAPVAAYLPSLGGINASINYGSSSSSAVANTGEGVQYVGGEEAKSLSYKHHHQSNDPVYLKMHTGEALAQSNSSVTIGSNTNLTGKSYTGHHKKSYGGGTDVNLSANIGLSSSEALANTGGGVQEVSGAKGQTTLEMYTGDATATSNSSVTITSATNLTRSKI